MIILKLLCPELKGITPGVSISFDNDIKMTKCHTITMKDFFFTNKEVVSVFQGKSFVNQEVFKLPPYFIP